MAEPDQIEASTQLLVEGNDQLNFFRAFVRRLGIPNIQVQNFGGVDELTLFVEALASTDEFKDRVRSLGIVRDSEVRPASSAFQSVQGTLVSAGLPVPDQMATPFGSSPSVSVLILPDNESPGMLETLLCRAFDGTHVGQCIESFLECASAVTGEGLHRPDKARAHAYIATRRDPYLSVGVAAQRSYWDLDHAVFDGIRNFIRSL